MEDNYIDLRNIRSLSGLKFYIPDYQRGYRWTSTQAIQMLNDFKEFCSPTNKALQKGQFYCLQPIVVKPHSWIEYDSNGNNIQRDGYEVIDGQQRLTTLFLILKNQYKLVKDIFPSFELFDFTYQTPRQSQGEEDFLKNIENAKLCDNLYVDYYYMKMVYDAINTWFEAKKNEGQKYKITMLLLDSDIRENKDLANNVRMLWYEIGKNEPASSVKIFTRLNMGKIPLTNAELIKAKFLQKDTNNSNEIAASLGLQQRIALEWDTIEHRLQDDKLWYFLRKSSSKDNYETRIEYLFDLLSQKDDNKEFYHTFNYFSDRINEKSREIVWNKVKDYMQKLEYWYNDTKLFHLIGFLIEIGVSISEIKELGYQEITNEDGSKTKRDLLKSKFLEKIQEKIKDEMNDIKDVRILNYNDDKKLRKALLLFNILTTVDNENSNIRFPFDKYKDPNTGWDKEHIASQTDKSTCPKGDKRLPWTDDMIYYFSGVHMKTDVSTKQSNLKEVEDYIIKTRETYNGKDIPDDVDNELKYLHSLIKIRRLLEINKRTEVQNSELDKSLESLYVELHNFFTNGDNILDKDNIGNMALLSADINRSYGNAFFPIKRMFIKEKDAEGVFVPIATRNVFMKYYSKKVNQMLIWNEDDAEAYREAICNKLLPYLRSK